MTEFRKQFNEECENSYFRKSVKNVINDENFVKDFFSKYSYYKTE